LSHSVSSSWLADPVATYAHLFEVNSAFGGATGTKWLTKFPYALPALLSAFSMLFIGMVVFLIIEEVGVPDHMM